MKAFRNLAAVAVAAVMLILATLLGLGWQTGQVRQAELQAQLDGYLLRHLQTTAENYLATGLQLEQMDALQDVIEREQSAFARIVAIDVFSAGGTVLYSTDTESRGQAAPETWLAELRRAGSWTESPPLQRRIGQRFDNDLGGPAGGLVVTLSTATAPVTLVQWKTRAQQALQWLGLAALAMMVAIAGVHLGLRRMFSPYDAAARALQGVATPSSDALVVAARQKHQHWAVQQQHAKQAQERLEALDHEL